MHLVGKFHFPTIKFLRHLKSFDLMHKAKGSLRQKWLHASQTHFYMIEDDGMSLLRNLVDVW